MPTVRDVTIALMRELGMELGFKHVESSPLTRSSYHAREQAADEAAPESAAALQ